MIDLIKMVGGVVALGVAALLGISGAALTPPAQPPAIVEPQDTIDLQNKAQALDDAINAQRIRTDRLERKVDKLQTK